MESNKEIKQSVPDWLKSFDNIRYAIRQYQWDRKKSNLSPNIRVDANGDRIMISIDEDSE